MAIQRGPGTLSWQDLRDLAVRAEALGFDIVRHDELRPALPACAAGLREDVLDALESAQAWLEVARPGYLAGRL